jgi:FKBP-type peptidyl-prolyl cis-trans isomerase (trigger factor)
MKVTKKEQKDNKVVLNVEVPKETVLRKYDEVYVKIGQDAKVPGFRPGKAPREVLEKHHGGLAREEVMKSLITETYEKGVKEEKIDVIDLPNITDVKLDGHVLTYTAEVEVKPEIKLKDYKGLKIKKEEIAVTPDDVKAYVDGLKKTRPNVDDDRLAKGLGYKTHAEFIACAEKQIYLKKENDSRARLEKELIDQVVKGASFTVPHVLVDRRAHELSHQALNQMVQYGLPEERARERLKEFAPKMHAEAEEQVKVFLVLETIARAEGIAEGDQMLNHVVEFLFAEANWK